jgi:hypothetical protein
MDTASYAAKYIKNDFPLHMITWLSYLFIPAICSMLSSCYLLFCGLLSIPIYSWKLLFHPDGHSNLDILQNLKGQGQLFDIMMIKISIAGEREYVFVP